MGTERSASRVTPRTFGIRRILRGVVPSIKRARVLVVSHGGAEDVAAGISCDGFYVHTADPGTVESRSPAESYDAVVCAPDLWTDDETTVAVIQAAERCREGPLLCMVDDPGQTVFSVAEVAAGGHVAAHDHHRGGEPVLDVIQDAASTPAAVLADGYLPNRLLLRLAVRRTISSPDACGVLERWYEEVVAAFDFRAPALGHVAVVGAHDADLDMGNRLQTPLATAALEVLRLVALTPPHVSPFEASQHQTAVLERTIGALTAFSLDAHAQQSTGTNGEQWRHRAEEAERRLAQAQRELQEAHSSESMRLGKALLRPLRPVVRGLQRHRSKA